MVAESVAAGWQPAGAPFGFVWFLRKVQIEEYRIRFVWALRRDPCPRWSDYPDRGCRWGHAMAGQPCACVDCPLPRCVEDKDGRARHLGGELATERDRWVVLLASMGWTDRAIAGVLACTRVRVTQVRNGLGYLKSEAVRGHS